MPVDVKYIVRGYLKQHGQDGLCADHCGCGLDDFAPCGDGPHGNCIPARRLVIPPRGEELLHPDTDEPMDYEGDAGDSVYIPA